MSEMATLLHAGLLQYLASLTKPEPDFLREHKKAAKAAGFPPIWIAPEQGAFIQLLLRLCGAKRVLEIGTQTGYSALVLAHGMPADGLVDSIDNDPAALAWAKQAIVGKPGAERIRLLEGDARTLLPTLPEGGYDAILVDADKDAYPVYLKQAERLIRSGGLVLFDNAFAYGQVLDASPARKKDDVWAIRAFNDLMARAPEMDGMIVPVGDGMWVARRR